MAGKGCRGATGYVVGAAFLLTAFVLVCTVFTMREHATSANYDAEGLNATEADGFPAIDWDYWKSVNPDVIGWITVSETDIDYPVVAAPQADPDYYLSHDVHRVWNPYGAVFLDAGCEDGLESANAVILAHHMDDGTMFAPVSHYSDADFARAHRTVLLQTPTSKQAVDVYAAEVVAGWEPVKKTSFETKAAFDDFVQKRLSASRMRLDDLIGGKQPERIVTLATCSYLFTPEDERTLAYAW